MYKGEMMNGARDLTILDEKLELFMKKHDTRLHTSCGMVHPATYRRFSNPGAGRGHTSH
jgi:hypothetical protein